MDLRRICVFCGSSPGTHPDYARVAREVGTRLASESIGVVYGGARTGLMGELADAALSAGGHVIGIIPEHLRAREVAQEFNINARFGQNELLMEHVATNARDSSAENAICDGR